MENKLQILTVANVRGYEKDGTAHLNLEDVARGLGFTTVAASGNVVVRWNTVHKYLTDFGVATSCNGDYQANCPEFIPENIFYRLAMKAKNEAAEKFQILVADEILPAIRKHGAYFKEETAEEILNDPYKLLKIFQNFIAEREERKRLQEVVSVQSVQIAEMQPKASYYDNILQSNEAIPVSVIAKDYGFSGKRMNQLLHQLKIQYPCGGTWLVYQDFAAQGYTQTKTIPIGDGYSKTHTNWTQKGRLFLYEVLKQHGHLPLIEQPDE